MQAAGHVSLSADDVLTFQDVFCESYRLCSLFLSLDSVYEEGDESVIVELGGEIPTFISIGGKR